MRSNFVSALVSVLRNELVWLYPERRHVAGDRCEFFTQRRDIRVFHKTVTATEGFHRPHELARSRHNDLTAAIRIHALPGLSKFHLHIRMPPS
jgi:hypothetical protein